MSTNRFIRKYKTRNDYMENPFSLNEFQEIRRLCELEESRFSKIVTNTIIYCASIFLIVALGDALESSTIKGFGFLLFFLFIVCIIPASFFLGPYAKVTIEGVTFKSFDQLGKYKTQSDDRFYPVDNNQNVYLPGTTHHSFVEKIRLMDRPFMRFEVDILNSLDS